MVTALRNWGDDAVSGFPHVVRFWLAARSCSTSTRNRSTLSPSNSSLPARITGSGSETSDAVAGEVFKKG